MDELLLLKYLESKSDLLSKIANVIKEEVHESGLSDYENTIMDKVKHLYHIEDGKKCQGEIFTLDKAKEIKSRYRGIISNNVSCYEIYYAINSHYHDYCKLFKLWFNDFESKIIEAAIMYWFRDEDYLGESKIKDRIEHS